ncbi:DUF805 domain-containing protein [Neolewinella aurantiaca]|uniref:DUF805 domain-containing protein n=1 Tax=Neolewinella aurantiaca TaxID=2602767 RepID=A0A5C7FAV7_9BACT|nr:DUF805 domain-containing protein [Neolewinella aurantiaca]TXF83557.1 DUF805 domain-containing protein [Neolewinella aurantiaca]
MVEYFKLAISKYAEFTGRSRRSEYWYFFLGNMILSIIATMLGVVLGETIGSMLSGLVSLALIVPGIAVGVRRLHDTGRSGWWLLIAIVPLIGAILLLVWFATDSQPGANEYGPNPKTGEAADITSHLVD